MKWLKLDSDLINDPKIIDLDNNQFRVYISLLCICAQQYNGEENKAFYISLKQLQHVSKLRRSSVEVALKLLSRNLEMNFNPTTNELLFPKFLKKQGSYYRGVIRKCTIDKDKDKEEEEEKEINYITSTKVDVCSELKKLVPSQHQVLPELCQNDLVNDFLSKIKTEIQKSWITLYQDKSFISHELIKMVSWLQVNQHKAPKSNFARFASAWLNRSWDQTRKQLTSKQINSKNPKQMGELKL